MSKRSRKKRQKHTGLKQHAMLGTVLTPPLAKLPIHLIDWEADLVPEHLWLAGLALEYGLAAAHRPFAEFMDALDEFREGGEEVLLGLLTDFASIPEPARSAFVAKYPDLVRGAFQEPIGRLLAFYPGCPASWLVTDRFLAEGGSLDPAVELPRMRDLVLRLLPGKDDFAGHVRTLPMIRLLKHGKIRFMLGTELPDLLPRYSLDASDDIRWKVQSFGRMTINSHVQQSQRFAPRDWPRYFWRHNYDLVHCEPVVVPIRGAAAPADRDEIQELERVLSGNAQRARDYLEQLQRMARIDLYRPERDEILFGLAARAVRLYVLVAEDPLLWARDTAAIMLRCLADTVITFGYLARAGADEDFKRFRDYGEGQEKLLMLHLQDSYPEARSLEGRSSEDISEGFGGFIPELLQVELGSWSKKDARRLAADAGMDDLYRLVFSPASSDLHGSWLSLKQSNLCHCGDALHRFHRLPAFVEPPLFIDTIEAVQAVMQRAFDAGVRHLGYPLPKTQLAPIPKRRAAAANKLED